MNIVDNILFQCVAQPRQPALCAPGTGIGLLSYGRLGLMIEAATSRLVRAGITPGQRVAVLVEDPLLDIVLLLALARIGAATVSGCDRQSAASLRLDRVVADKAPDLGIDNLGIDNVVTVDLGWTRPDPRATPFVQSPGDGPCRIVVTSRVAGLTKAVTVSHSLLGARIARQLTVLGAEAADCGRWFSDAPVATSLGFQFVIATLWRGGFVLLPGRSSDETVDAMEDYQVRGCLTSRGGLAMLLATYQRNPGLQSELNVVINAGDALSKSLATVAQARVCPLLVSVCGSAEAGTIASAPWRLIEAIPGAVGFVNPGVRVEVVDETGAVLPAGRDGILRIASPYAVTGYDGDQSAAHDAVAPGFRDGWFYPGEIASVADGVLRIASHRDDLVTIGSDEVHPQTIEAVVSRVAGIAEAAVSAVTNAQGDRGMVAFVVPGERPPDERTLRDHCQRNLPLHLVPTRFVSVPRLPREPNGKIARQQLAAAG